MYNLIYDADFDDEWLCENENTEWRKKNDEKKYSANIHPNPARNNATLHYDIPEGEAGEFVILNSMGQIILKQQLTGGRSSFIFNTIKYNEGIYFYRVKSNDLMIDSGKLVIIH